MDPTVQPGLNIPLTLPSLSTILLLLTADQNYSEANRQAWTPNGAASGQSVSNSSAKATFSINANTTIYGAFLTSNNTKGGTSGKLYAAGNLASSKSLSAGDQLLVTATFTTADDGV